MDWKKEWKPLVAIATIFALFYYLPIETIRVRQSILEAFYLAKWYAREHVLLCLIPAFFIAGAIAVFISQASVIKYLGSKTNKVLSYGVASVSGSVLAVCSCTVLPLFAGIYRMGAGLGPATAFLYAGPAINVLAVILTARVLGLELGIARAIGAVVFSIIIGLIMQFMFRNEETDAKQPEMTAPDSEAQKTLVQNALFFGCMIFILVFANWGKADSTSGFWYLVYDNKWIITSVGGLLLGLIMFFWFNMSRIKLVLTAIATITLAVIFPDQPLFAFSAAVLGVSFTTATGDEESAEWFSQTWGFARQILPLLLGGVLVAGLLLGRPGHEGIIPDVWISSSVGGNSISTNLFASVVGAFMYFATLTEIPILQGLMDSGMGKGPALALLLAGPALSLPNILVIRSVMGTKKTIVFIILVIFMATISGLIYGSLF